MQIDKETLLQTQRSIEQQKEQALSVYHQTSGQLDLIRALISRLDAPEPEAPVTPKKRSRSAKKAELPKEEVKS